ncbi:hypothetical protein FOL47_004125, partial [Perkinsus chesapeaki]
YNDDLLLTTTDQYQHLQQLKQRVAKNVEDWLQESIMIRTDARAKEVDRRNSSTSSSSSTSSLIPGQKVFFKPNQVNPNLRRGIVTKCLNSNTGVYSIIFDDDPSKTSSINGRYLVPYDDLDHRDFVIRFVSNTDTNYEEEDVLVVNFSDASNRFYFAEFKSYNREGKLTVHPLELQGARLLPTSSELLVDQQQ